MSNESSLADKSTKNTDSSGFTKWELVKILAAIFILLAASLTYYLYVRKEILHNDQKRAEVALKHTENIIRSRFGKVETILGAMQLMAEHELNDPDEMFVIAHYTVKSNPIIKSAGLAFNKYYYPQKGCWFEPAAANIPGIDTLVVEQIGNEGHDYTKMEWYTEGLMYEEGVWSDPYPDHYNKDSYLMTFSLPVHNAIREPVGVICADIDIDTIAKFIRSVKLYPHSFCTLVTESGIEVVPPPSTKLNDKYYIFTKTMEDKNIILTIYIPYSDMYGRLRKSTLVFFVLALLGMLAVFIITYSYIRNIKHLNEVKINEERIESELSIARNIQLALLPSSPLPEIAGNMDVKGMQISAKYVGGDLYDYYLRDNKLLFCVGDVSGKGVPAALLMAISHSLFRTISAHNDHPDEIMKELNVSMSANNPDMMFITMFLGIMDLKEGKIRYCNAGHNPPIVVSNGKAEFLSTDPSLLLGVEPSAKFTAYDLTLAPGDTLFLYSDGLTEAENERKELFGEKRALKTAAGFGEMTAEEQIDRMCAAVSRFVGNAEQSDDLTMLAVRRQPALSMLTLTNDLNELTKLEPFLEDTFRDKNLDASVLSQISLALEEAIANVIMYAYPEGQKGTVTLKIDGPSEGVVRMEISDAGTPFNPLEHKEANLDVSLEERQIGGLGIHLVKEIMDTEEYVYRDGHNILSLSKRVD